jgi:hypothetical protein
MIKFNKFRIDKYKAIKDSSISVLNEPIPLIGVNESGKSSALEAMARFDYRNDTIADQKKWKFLNRYMPNENVFSVSAEVLVDEATDLDSIFVDYPEIEKTELLALGRTSIHHGSVIGIFFLSRIINPAQEIHGIGCFTFIFENPVVTDIETIDRPEIKIGQFIIHVSAKFIV